MRLQKIIVALAVALLVGGGISLGVFFYDRSVACQDSGLARDAALQVARWKLGQRWDEKRFALVYANLGADFSWSFNFRRENCEINIAVDRCGIVDSGGESQGCF